MSHTELRITSAGDVRCLHCDAVNWQQLGSISVRRASHVEFCRRRQQWYVQFASPRSPIRRLLQHILRRPMGEIVCWSDSRADAIAFELNHFGPGGPGWPGR